MTKLEVVKEFRFEAAHILPQHPGKCSKLHGHSWVMRVGVRAPVNARTGFVVDYVDLKALVQPLVDLWDHSYLGSQEFCNYVEFPEDTPWRIPQSFSGYPSSENLVLYVVDYLRERIGDIPGQLIGDAGAIAHLSLVEIEETCTSRCTWRSEHGR